MSLLLLLHGPAGAITLSGAATGAATATGSLADRKTLAGTTAGGSSTAAPLAIHKPLAGKSADASLVTGSLSLTKRLTGTSASAASAAGSLSAQKRLGGTAAGSSSASGTLAGRPPFSGSTEAVSSASGALAVRKSLAGLAAGASQTQAVLTVLATGTLEGKAVGLSSVAGDLDLVLALSGKAAGAATAQGTLSTVGVAAVYPLTHTIAYFTAGDFPAWHPTLSDRPIAFNRMDGDGINQVWRINADGTGATCLTDPAPTGAPAATFHKGSPAWDSTGDWLVISAEMTDHYGLTTPPNLRYLSAPGAGWWCNLWAIKSDGSAAYQLTNLSNGGGDGGSGIPTRGVLYPRFNRAGTKIVFSMLVGTVYGQGELGWWQLWQMDWAVVGGVPTVSNAAAVTLPTTANVGTFFEAHGYSYDGSKILFTSDRDEADVHGMDIWTYNPTTQAITRLTNSPAQWDEHYHESALGDKAVRMSTGALPGYSLANPNGTLRAELGLMATDGTGWRQLTHFNTQGYAEYGGGETVAATTSAWSPDDTKLLVCREYTGASFPARSLWMITFAGSSSTVEIAAKPTHTEVELLSQARRTLAATPERVIERTDEARRLVLVG